MPRDANLSNNECKFFQSDIYVYNIYIQLRLLCICINILIYVYSAAMRSLYAENALAEKEGRVGPRCLRKQSPKHSCQGGRGMQGRMA